MRKWDLFKDGIGVKVIHPTKYLTGKVVGLYESQYEAFDPVVQWETGERETMYWNKPYIDDHDPHEETTDDN